MKVYISENIDKAIEGFNIIPIVYGAVDLGSIPTNAASTIIAIDALDSIKSENVSNFIGSVVSKMRLNSTLYLGGVDAYALSRGLLSAQISISDYNNIIDNKNGIYACKYVCDILQGYKLNIVSAIFKGINYEITATRSIDAN